jgi:hypothetical protein
MTTASTGQFPRMGLSPTRLATERRCTPCERFTSPLTGYRASLGVGAVGYSLPRGGLSPPILCQQNWRTPRWVNTGLVQRSRRFYGGWKVVPPDPPQAGEARGVQAVLTGPYGPFSRIVRFRSPRKSSTPVMALCRNYKHATVESEQMDFWRANPTPLNILGPERLSARVLARSSLHDGSDAGTVVNEVRVRICRHFEANCSPHDRKDFTSSPSCGCYNPQLADNRWCCLRI